MLYLLYCVHILVEYFNKEIVIFLELRALSPFNNLRGDIVAEAI
jgi:hypothetical protein